VLANVHVFEFAMRECICEVLCGMRCVCEMQRVCEMRCACEMRSRDASEKCDSLRLTLSGARAQLAVHITRESKPSCGTTQGNYLGASTSDTLVATVESIE